MQEDFHSECLVVMFATYTGRHKKHQCNYQHEKNMIPVPLLIFHLLQAFGTSEGSIDLITK